MTALTASVPCEQVVQLLERCSLCYLSTFHQEAPHLSLMNFTYYQADEVIIMSTRRDTKKFALLESSKNVAVLVHDFPGQRCRQQSAAAGGISYEEDPVEENETAQTTAAAKTYSITMNGRARIEVCVCLCLAANST